MINDVPGFQRAVACVAAGLAAFFLFNLFQGLVHDAIALPAMQWVVRSQPSPSGSLASATYGALCAVAAVPFAALFSILLSRILPAARHFAWALFCFGVNVPILIFAFSGVFSSPVGAFSLFYGSLTLLAMQLWVLLISTLRRRHAV